MHARLRLQTLDVTSYRHLCCNQQTILLRFFNRTSLTPNPISGDGSTWAARFLRRRRGIACGRDNSPLWPEVTRLACLTADSPPFVILQPHQINAKNKPHHAFQKVKAPS